MLRIQHMTGVMRNIALPHVPCNVCFWARWNLRTTSSDDLMKLQVADKLRVATREVPPFAMRNEDGQWSGISIDLLREVKAELEEDSGHEIEIEFQVMTLAEMLDATEKQRSRLGGRRDHDELRT